MINKSNLDNRIMDVEGGVNPQTYREFIRESEMIFGLNDVDLDRITDEQLKHYLKELNYIWEK